MRRTNTLLFVTLGAGIALGAALGWSLKTPAPTTAKTPAAQADAPRKILYYRNPMDPKITADKPSKDSMGMDYVPVYADTVNNDAGIRIDPRQVQNLGVRTGVVEKRAFARTVHTVGTVLVDERGVSAFSPKVSGWLERLHAKAVGDVVERGQSLAEIYSPELLSAQEEYRIAAQASQKLLGVGDPAMHPETKDLVQAARERLRLLDIPDVDIAALAQGKPAHRTVSLRAPYRGIVTELDVR